MPRIWIILAMGFAGITGACETPTEVRTQSAVISAQVAKVRGDLNRYAADEKTRALARAERIIEVLQEVEAAEERSNLRLLSDQRQWLSGVLKNLEETENARKMSLKRQSEFAASVRASAKTFKVPAQQLQTVEEALAKISTKANRADQLKFFLKYAQSVAKNYRKLREESEKKAKEADKENDNKSKKAKKDVESIGK
jgi:hypothetical protein